MNLSAAITEGAASSPASTNPWVSRVYLVDDHPFFAAALASLINTEADLSVCGVGCETPIVSAEVARTVPDLIVMDVNLSARNNWALPIELRKFSKQVPLLFVSSMQNPQAEVGLKWLEPCSFVEKTKDPADIVKAIRQALNKVRRFQSLHPTAASPTPKRES